MLGKIKKSLIKALGAEEIDTNKYISKKDAQDELDYQRDFFAATITGQAEQINLAVHPGRAGEKEALEYAANIVKKFKYFPHFNQLRFKKVELKEDEKGN